MVDHKREKTPTLPGNDQERPVKKADVIEPVPITIKQRETYPAGISKRNLRPWLLIAVLPAMIGGGWQLFGYLSDNPLQPEVMEPQTTVSATIEEPSSQPLPAPAVEVPETVETKQSESSMEESKEKTSEFLKTEHVLALLQRGRNHEEAQNFQQAKEFYQKALQLDSDSAEVKNAVMRLGKKIRQKEFDHLMSTGLAAFHENDFSTARQALVKATAIKPESNSARETLAQIEGAAKIAEMRRQQKKALIAAQAEKWEEALAAYEAVLKIDPMVQFAIDGKKHSENQRRIVSEIQSYLDTPHLLESDRYIEQATLLLHEASELENKGPVLTARLEELKQLVTIAQTPIQVIIQSDNLTEVAVYKVGKLGRFSMRELALRPGTYTVVGARDGYRDVRIQIVVKPDQGPVRFTVQCREKI